MPGLRHSKSGCARPAFWRAVLLLVLLFYVDGCGQADPEPAGKGSTKQQTPTLDTSPSPATSSAATTPAASSQPTTATTPGTGSTEVVGRIVLSKKLKKPMVSVHCVGKNVKGEPVAPSIGFEIPTDESIASPLTFDCPEWAPYNAI